MDTVSGILSQNGDMFFFFFLLLLRETHSAKDFTHKVVLCCWEAFLEIYVSEKKLEVSKQIRRRNSSQAVKAIVSKSLSASTCPSQDEMTLLDT
ncbi:hypothetical protein CDAR_318491 [Caerostris darwini]|uniref:Uncharacterized protein n=1 Tax=Caerostris darwini TaxID=1538125 RepID=A0AAV4Q9Q4_9ARAC|nr:hypothetical protein CDAR_318491 [Caerostris darwini]